MSRKRSRGREVLSTAAEVGPEDGTDPRRFHDRRGAHGKPPGRKAHQLCGQVHQALLVILPGLADEVLRNLTVVSVEPAPHSGRLLVTVAGPVPADATDRHLRLAAGLLRSEVAGAVHRRKAPELIFRVEDQK
jgi:ribosome-binding factor A